MVAERVTQEDLDGPRALEDTQRDKADHAARVENDFAFHLAIANLSGNRLIAYILTAIKDLFCAIEPAILSPRAAHGAFNSTGASLKRWPAATAKPRAKPCAHTDRLQRRLQTVTQETKI